MDSVLVSGWHALVPCRFSRLKKSIKCQMSWFKQGIGVLLCPPILSRMRYLSEKEIGRKSSHITLLQKSNIKILRIQPANLHKHNTVMVHNLTPPQNFTFFGHSYILQVQNTFKKITAARVASFQNNSTYSTNSTTNRDCILNSLYQEVKIIS